MLNTKLM